MLSWDEIMRRAVSFSKAWENGADEKQQGQAFMRDLLHVFGAGDEVINAGFEYPVKIAGHDKYIDFIWKSHIAIEMKSRGENLSKAFKQLQNYMEHLPCAEDVPDLWLCCDFENMRLRRCSTNEVWNFKTAQLRKHIKKFADVAGYKSERVRQDQTEVNVKAAEKMAKLHDALKERGYDGHDLEVYLVRLLFCMFAGDTGIFTKGDFYNYINDSKKDGSDLSERLGKLFEVLDLDYEKRKKRTLISEELKRFRYINGGLFRGTLPLAEFDEKMRKILLECRDFDWSEISPAIFGAMFQGVMDKEKRRETGAHYTSEENIKKLINPLFLDELWAEFERVKTSPKALDKFHEKIAGLKFLDPACGCGNFLIVAYRELRLLELEILKMKHGITVTLDVLTLLKVSVEQFYGIEYEDFPCQIATAGMWLVDHQMNLLISEHFGIYYDRLPLTQSATIINSNALRIDWETVIPKSEASYILGNPPFVGFTYMTAEQKNDMNLIFPKTKNLDYVSAWYMKAIDYIQNSNVECAFVSTNSICQGETVPVLWKKLFAKNIVVNFAYRPFVWSNEAKGKAAVHCVIIGFSLFNRKEKLIYNNQEQIIANNINPYLLDGANIIVESRSKPLYDVPAIVYGNKPADGGNLIIEAEDYEDFIEKEPLAKKYIKRLIGSAEYINNKKRYCLWLVGTSPSELRQMPLVMERVEKCRQMRLNSIAAGIRKFATTPAIFAQVTQPPNTDYIVIPSVSSEKRLYIPIGFVDRNTIASNAVHIIPNATLYHFGILTSSVHMAWVRAICGRLKSDYRYSKDIVYNNFPWVEAPLRNPPASGVNRYAIRRAGASPLERGATEAIESLAQGVLDARALYPESSLADLYDPLTTPPELLKAHKALDKAVMKLYGFKANASEEEVVAGLMRMYQELVL